MKLEIKDLACGYSTEKIVLEHVNFHMSDHEICCILGPNGVGKTTLFKTLLRFLSPLNGRIEIDGENISKWSARKMAQHAAYVAQNHVPPFPYLAEDVVMLGRVSSTGYFKQPGSLDYEIAHAAMEDMGILHLKDRVYTDISGGERQLVLLARAIAQEPQLLAMDEPTTGLDYGNQIRVLEKICSLKERGYGIIMTTHTPEHAFLCDAQVVLLEGDGTMVFGTASQVVTEKNLKDAYGVRVKILEYNSSDGGVIRTCAPAMQIK